MSFHRVLVVAVATLFSVGMTSLASADCCGWGYSAPVAYAAPAAMYGGCGACAAPAPAVYSGCGACAAPTAAVVYAQPVAPAPIAVVAPVMPTGFGGPCCGFSGCGNCGFSDWSGGCGSCGVSVAWNGGGGCGNCGVTAWNGGGCGNCGGCGACGQQVAYAAPYVVNQGPVYSGPGIMAYQTYSPETAYVPATDYPYVPGQGPGYGSGYGYGYGAAQPYAPYYRHPYYRPRFAYRAPYPHRYYGPARRRYYR